jgi:membrane protein implicated in regulation of membrane protease activity
LGKSWLGALLFLIFVGVIFAQVLSYAAEMDLWMGFATFLIALVLFFGIIILVSRRRGSERVRQYAELRRMQVCDFKEEDEP